LTDKQNMALRKGAVLDDLDTVQAYTGEFGSGARNVSVNRLARPTTLSPAAQARILGTTSTTTGQTAFQKADQNRFDRSFGFTPTHGDINLATETNLLNPKKAPTSVPVTPAMRTVATTTPGPLNQLAPSPGTIPASVLADPFSGVNANSRPPMYNTDLRRPGPVFPVEPTPPSRAELAGRTTRRVLGNVLDAIPKETTFGSSHAIAPAPVEKPIIDVPRIASNFFRGFNTAAPPATPPATTPAGVTNATAAQFQTPTKENPVPVTDTTPETNIDRSQTSLAKFGLSEDELTKRKRLFAGF
jgi:hypothetical protein